MQKDQGPIGETAIKNKELQQDGQRKCWNSHALPVEYAGPEPLAASLQATVQHLTEPLSHQPALC